ncbi:MAG: Ig domain-containing protein [Verrucomicrobiota bacterium]
MIKKVLWIGLLVFGTQAAWAFSLLGPVRNGGDAWQLTLIGYDPLTLSAAPPFFIDPLLTGPKNLGEEYRRNTPVVYYAANANFLDYFGSNGVVALDGAFAILNNVFTNENGIPLTNGVDSYSPGLTGFSLNSIGMNYQAQGLGLLDLKSTTLSLMTEQLGLADAVRYTWALHDRNPVPGSPCPNEYYLVIERNFDFIASPLNQLQSSFYVNGELYTYSIYENCGAPGASPPDADALEFATDPLFDNPPVASGFGEDPLLVGEFYTGLSRDDVAGLRYLLTTNNMNTESPATGTLLENTSNPTTLLTTSDLGALVAFAPSNSPAVLTAQFPGVVIASSTSYFTNISTPNIITIATNYYGEPAGTPPHIITITNGVTWSIVQRFVTTFANVVTNSYYSTNSTATLLTTTFGAQIGAPVGSPFVTKTTAKNITLTNTPTGDYYVVPAGSCGLTVVHVWQTNVVYTTNVITSAVNPDGSSTTISLVTHYTNHILEVQPCNFAPSPTALYQGIGRMQFVRANYDSLLGQFFQPLTNTYSMVSVTNSRPGPLTFQRVVTTPDFLFTAQDLGASGGVPAPLSFSRNVTFDQGNIYPGLAGPGVINPPSTIAFTKIGPSYINLGPAFLNGPLGYIGRQFLWGSFDGTTNDPVVYPNGTSIANLAAEVLIQIYPASLPNGTNGVGYNVPLSATGGQSPNTWALAQGSAALPGNLSLSAGGTLYSSDPLGVPVPLVAPAGTYYFTIQMTDAANRSVAVNYAITIN